VNPLLDLLPVPAERDLPPGRLDQRAAALVAAVETERPRRARLRRWLTMLLASAVASTVLAAGGARVDTTRLAETAAVVAAGSGLVALAVAPRPTRLAPT
jgi:hypothetical protein